MARQVIDLTTPQPNGKMGEPTKSAWEKVNDMTLEIYAGLQPAQRGFIEGLRMEYVSGNSLRFSSGAAYIESAGEVLSSPVAVTKTGISLVASAMYHCYIYKNGASVDFEISGSVPATPYIGTARSKTGDTSRRYIGSFKTGASASIIKFVCAAGFQIYDVAAGNADNRLVTGNATTSTPFSISSAVPITASLIRVAMTNTGGTGSMFLGNPGNMSFIAIFASSVAVIDIPVQQSDLRLFYRLTSAGTAVVDCYGFNIER